MGRQSEHLCAFCSQRFGSKNKLFAHLRNSACTPAARADGLQTSEEEPQERVALAFGRLVCEGDGDVDWQLALWKALDVARGVDSSSKLQHGGSSSSTSKRASYFEAGGPPFLSFASHPKGAEALAVAASLPSVCDIISFSTEVVAEESLEVWCGQVNKALPENMKIFRRVGGLPSTFFANGCLRRCYVCIVPSSLLLSEETLAGLAVSEIDLDTFDPDDEASGQASPPAKHARHNKRGEGDPRWGTGEAASSCLQEFAKLKSTMRHFQGEHHLHNFAPTARLCSHDAAAKRFIYRFRAGPEISPTKARQGGSDPSRASFRAVTLAVDALLPGQFESMLGLAIAVARGKLQDNWLDRAFDCKELLTLPSFPPGWVFLDHPVYPKQFHHSLQKIMEGPSAAAWRRVVEDSFITRALEKDLPTLFWKEFGAFEQKSMLAQAKPSPESGCKLDEVEEACKDVLRLLRAADRSGNWPSISKGREKVIEAETLVENGGTGGSFTFGSMPAGLEEPAANKLFPELARSAFELELKLRPGRAPSSTIAVNKHAQFRPHIDSGAGAGQSISLIVALGDFTGGELVVEGEVHDIRYRPREFNGWTQRHWTKPFEGERYSLVWFTPRGCEDRPGLQLFPPVMSSSSSSLPLASSALGHLSSSSSSSSSLREVTLSNKMALPSLGYGSFQMKDSSCEDAIYSALEAGYRLIDTASIYKNEESVGSAVLRWEADHPNRPPEDQILIESKCSTYEMGYDKALAAFEASLTKLQRTTLDVYLIHWPAVAKKKHSGPEHRIARHQTWRALEHLYKTGRVRCIGVSNFSQNHLEALFEDGIEITPMINQIEVHPFYTPTETIDFCLSRGIHIQAYSPLAGGPGSNVARASGGELDGTKRLLTHPSVQKIASDVKKTPAQVVLRWALQRGFSVIPRSSRSERIAENIDVFDFSLSPDQVEELNALCNAEGAQKYCWDPSGVL